MLLSCRRLSQTCETFSDLILRRREATSLETAAARFPERSANNAPKQTIEYTLLYIYDFEPDRTLQTMDTRVYYTR
jgi:hypothetical protein